MAGLIIEDDEGRYFAIGWEELRRYRVPAASVAAIQALIHGEEPASLAEADTAGYGDETDASNALVVAVMGEATATGGRLASRRLGAWVLLR